jgi:hypothetical protein
MTDGLNGWARDPFGRHDWRWFAAGTPTDRVRDGATDSTDPVEPAPVAGPGLPHSPAPQVFLPDATLPPPFPPSPGADRSWAASTTYDQPFPAPAPAPAPTPTPTPTPTKNRGRLWIGLGIVVALAAVIGLAIAAGVITITSRHTENVAADPASATGISYTSPDGRFQAKFPRQPTTKTVPSSVANTRLSVFYAVTGDPLTEVGNEQVLNDEVPRSAYDSTLRIAMSSFAAGANATLDSQKVTTFRGYPARTGSITISTGEKLTVTIFFNSATSLYVLASDAGTSYDNLVKSFEILK